MQHCSAIGPISGNKQVDTWDCKTLYYYTGTECYPHLNVHNITADSIEIAFCSSK